LSDGSAFVTLITLQPQHARQARESVEVLLDRLIRDIPTGDGVALGAVGPHLTPMNVGVAVRAIFPDISEDRLDVGTACRKLFRACREGDIA